MRRDGRATRSVVVQNTPLSVAVNAPEALSAVTACAGALAVGIHGVPEIPPLNVRSTWMPLPPGRQSHPRVRPVAHQ